MFSPMLPSCPFTLPLGPRAMTALDSFTAEHLDFIEELRLRRWARENYVPSDERSTAWHPIIHEEMTRKDRETSDTQLAS